MENELLKIVSKEISNKAKWSEIMEYLGVLFDEALENNNVEDIDSINFDDIIDNLNNNLDYSKATEENLKNYFEAIVKIYKFKKSQ